MAIYEQGYTIYLSDATGARAALAQEQYPDGILVAPGTAATLYNAPIINSRYSTVGVGSWIDVYQWGTGTAIDVNTASAIVPAGFVPNGAGNLEALAGAPGGTLRWRGSFQPRGVPSPAPTKEAVQTHRWLNGFERPNQGEHESAGNPTQRKMREASRTLDGLGLALRSPANEFVTMTLPTTGAGFPTKDSWERFYVRLRKYPTANEVIWGAKGSVEAGTAVLLLVSPTGQLLVNNKGNQVFPGTNVLQAGQIPLNVWTRIDLVVAFARNAGGGSGDGGIVVYVNGAVVGQFACSGPGGTVVGGAGGLNTLQNHSSSYVGNENTPTNGLEIDYDDWTNKTVPQLFSGDDWLNGTHIMPLRLEGFGPGHSGSWTGDFRTLDGVPVNGQVDSVDSAVAGIDMEVTTDYTDRQIGCSGIQLSLFHKTASGTTESLGYAFNGGAFTMQNVTTSTGTWATPTSTDVAQILYSAGGNTSLPTLTSLNLKYTRDGAATNRQVQALQASAEYVGQWGPEDQTVPPQKAVEFPPRQGPHNSPYPDANFGQQTGTRPPGLVQVMSGTYTGNGTGQDITLQLPAHWIWVRPVSAGGTGGSRWWSSCLAGHDPLTETPDKGNLVRAFLTSESAGPTGYKFRVSGNNANSNAAGVTYQWVAFSDQSMRFCLNGSYLTLGGTASFTHNLFDSAFTPRAGFLLPELGTNAATTGLYFKGSGAATLGASIMNAAESASVVQFNAGSITPQTILNLASAQTAYSLWRDTDGDGVSGAVAITNYTGDGTGARNIALALGGRSPIFALVQPNNGTAYVRDPSHTGTTSSTVTAAGGVTVANAITGGAANQISVDAALNALGVVYSVFVLAGSVAGGWSSDPTSPVILVDPVTPTAPFAPQSPNGWWSSTALFTGAATLLTYPPQNPQDARNWEKINAFATGNAGFYAGFPPPGVVLNNRWFIYAGNDYQIGGSQPTIRIFDGTTDRLMVTVPDVAGVKAIAIMAMMINNGIIYFSTLDAGNSSSTYTGRVFSLDANSLVLTQLGAQFTAGECPYALCWHMGRLFMGTNKSDGSAAKIYWIRPGIDTAWTLDHTLTTNGVGGCTALCSYRGKLYIGCNATAAMGTNKILVRDTVGTYTTSFTLTSGGTFRASNACPAMIVFNDKLYASYWNPDTTPDCYVKQWDETTWRTVYTGSAGTVRPFSGMFIAQNTLFLVGGGSGLSACLLSSPDGTTWTDLTAFLTGPQTTETAMPIVGILGV